MQTTYKYRSFYLIFLFGLLIRLILMPFTLQADLISMSYRSNLMLENSLWDLNTGQDLGHYLYALNLLFIRPLFTQAFSSYYSQPFGASPGSLTASVGDWLNFINQGQINSFIFFLKIPHLFADIIIFYLLFKKFKNKGCLKNILLLWWFNPVNLYAFYVFARHDSLTLLALFLVIIYSKKQAIAKAILAFTAAFKLRFQPILYLPLFLIFIFKNSIKKKKLWQQLCLGFFLVFIYLTVENFLPHNAQKLDQIKAIPEQYSFQTTKQTSAWYQLPGFLGRAFRTATSVGGKSTLGRLIVYTLTYALLNLFYLFLKKAKNQTLAIKQFIAMLYLSLVAYFVINSFSPHYFVWLSLFATLIYASFRIRKKFLITYLLSVLFWGLMGLFDKGNFAINLHLFLPISSLLFNIPQFWQTYSFTPHVFSIAKHLFNFSLFYSAYLVIKELVDNKVLLQKKILTTFLVLFLLFKPQQIQAAKYPVWESEGKSELVLLKEKETYQFSFISLVDKFSAIDLKFDTSRDQAFQELDFCLKRDSDEQCLVENNYNAGDFYNRAFYPFGFEPITDAKNQQFTIELTLKEEGSLRQLPLYFIEGNYVLSTEKNTKELLPLILNDLENKYQAQQSFFHFWFALLAINLLAIVSLLFSKKAKV